MNKENRKLFNKYLEEESLRNHTMQGLSNLKQRIPKYFQYIEEHDLKVTQVKIKEAQMYQGWLIETGKKNGKKYSSRSIHSFITVASNFYNFLKRNGIVLTNPFLEIRRIRNEYKLPENILREKEINLLLNELSNYDKVKGLKEKIIIYRVHLIAELMYSTGMRISEVAKLKVNDIDLTRSIVNIEEGKGGYSRIAFLNEYAKTILTIYINEMRELTFNEWNEKNNTLFGLSGGSLEKSVNKVLKETSNTLNLPVFTSHGFRHALGFHLLRSGCDIRYIQEILGHKSLKSTEIYTKVDKENLKKVLDKFHPRTFKKKREE